MFLFKNFVFVRILILISVLKPSLCLADFVGHGGMIRGVDVSFDGSKVITGSFDYSAILWNFADQSEIIKLNGHNGPVTSVLFIKNNRALTTSDDKSAIYWDLDLGVPIFKLLGHEHKIMSSSVDTSGEHAATGGWDANVYVWNLNNGQNINKIRVNTPVNAVTFLGSSKKVAVGGHDGGIYIFNSISGSILGSLKGHRLGITSLSSSADCETLLSGSIDGSVKLWNVISLQEIGAFRGHERQVYSVQFLIGDQSAISSGTNGKIIHWDLLTGKILKKIAAHDRLAWAIKTSRDGRFVVSGGADDHAKVWHLATGDQINASRIREDELQPWLKSAHPGSIVFKKCAKCHAIRASYRQRSGPHLENLFGRQVGGLPEYNYSDALKKSHLIWNHKTLVELFRQGPDKYLPGTKMPVQKIINQDKLQNLMLYLRDLTSTPLYQN